MAWFPLYKLVNRTPVPCKDIHEYSDWELAHPDERRVASDEIHGVTISTVFLGINHNLFGEEPWVFETMVFGGEHNGYLQRYSTWQAAEEGHLKMVTMIRRDFIKKVS